MRFGHPGFLWLALGVVIAMTVALRLAARARRRRMAVFTGSGTRAWADPGFSAVRERSIELMTILLPGLLLVTLARPMWYRRDKASELQGVPYLIALDASRSMLATDVRPSRWAAATNAIDQFLDRTRADRIGLITFSGVAYLNAPLTFDTTALRTTLRYIDPNVLEDPGSSLAAALDRAGRYFLSNRISPRLVIVVSDGEDLAGNPVEMARRLARSQKVVVCSVGVGTPGGARVPLNRYYGGVAKNSFGQEVTSRLNESNLQRLAAVTGGRYYRLQEGGDALERLRSEVLAPMAEAAAHDDMKNYAELYFVPLGMAAMCLLLVVALRSAGIRPARVASPIREREGAAS